MSNTLYRKYRPTKFSEIIGQTHIVQTLSNAIKRNRTGQAFLFTGPRGTGKTTLARVFAKAVNCEKRDGHEPCQRCEICKNISEGRSLDIIEIDAASNTGVDNIRELREAVKLPPTQAKYKVYIIDEVHMLSTGAFNALLKTLEEPPAHVIFILATTEIHKVPETIISRCQRFDFSRLTLEQIVRKLSGIAKAENVQIKPDALEMIAIASEGGMRDAESLLSQIIALEDKNITAREVEEILGAARHESVEKMTSLILKKDMVSALILTNNLAAEGINFEVFYKSLLNYLRQVMIVSVSPDLANIFSLELTKEQTKKLKAQGSSLSPAEILEALNILIDCRQNVRSTFIPSLPLEMAIVRYAAHQKSAKSGLSEIPADLPRSTSQPAISRPDKESDFPPDKREPENVEKKYGSPVEKHNLQSVDIDTFKEKWPDVIKATHPHNHSLMAFLSNCEPVKIEDGTILIVTKYNLYKEKLNEKKNRLTIEDVAAKILNSQIKVKFVTEEEAGIKVTKQLTTEDKQQKESKNGSLLDEAMNIMGGKIVDE